MGLPCLMSSAACMKKESIRNIVGRSSDFAAMFSVVPSLCSD